MTAFAVGAAAPLFARIDMRKMLDEIAAEMAPAEPEKKETESLPLLPEIAIDDFAKVDLRVAKVIACEPVKKAKKLLKLTLDDGTGAPRTVCSGIAKWYTPDALVGRQVIVVANLKPPFCAA